MHPARRDQSRHAQLGPVAPLGARANESAPRSSDKDTTVRGAMGMASTSLESASAPRSDTWAEMSMALPRGCTAPARARGVLTKEEIGHGNLRRSTASLCQSPPITQDARVHRKSPNHPLCNSDVAKTRPLVRNRIYGRNGQLQATATNTDACVVALATFSQTALDHGAVLINPHAHRGVAVVAPNLLMSPRRARNPNENLPP